MTSSILAIVSLALLGFVAAAVVVLLICMRARVRRYVHVRPQPHNDIQRAAEAAAESSKNHLNTLYREIETLGRGVRK